MANVGAGETYNAYLIKYENVTKVDSFIKEEVPIEDIVAYGYAQHFKYRYLTTSEMTYQPISNYLKGKYDSVIFTSETEINPKERDKVMLDDLTSLAVLRVLPQVQIGMFLLSKKPPRILELS